jgi:hypothetical protein
VPAGWRESGTGDDSRRASRIGFFGVVRSGGGGVDLVEAREEVLLEPYWAANSPFVAEFLPSLELVMRVDSRLTGSSSSSGSPAASSRSEMPSCTRGGARLTRARFRRRARAAAFLSPATACGPSCASICGLTRSKESGSIAFLRKEGYCRELINPAEPLARKPSGRRTRLLTSRGRGANRRRGRCSATPWREPVS